MTEPASPLHQPPPLQELPPPEKNRSLLSRFLSLFRRAAPSATSHASDVTLKQHRYKKLASEIGLGTKFLVWIRAITAEQAVKQLTRQALYKLFEDAVDGTDLISDTVDKIFGKQPFEQKRAIAHILMSGMIEEYNRATPNDQKNLWWPRILHIQLEYLHLASGLASFTKADRNAFLEACSKNKVLEYIQNKLNIDPSANVIINNILEMN